jgi:hypothetical protein
MSKVNGYKFQAAGLRITMTMISISWLSGCQSFYMPMGNGRQHDL